jgi:hypothetical protein
MNDLGEGQVDQLTEGGLWVVTFKVDATQADVQAKPLP